MRTKFPGYYRRSTSEYEMFLNKGEIVIDTCVLIDVIRSEDDKEYDEFIDLLFQIKEHLWFPHQVVVEFLENSRNTDSERKSRIEALFDGRYGESYSMKKRLEIFEQGEIRYKHAIPPGFLDQKGKSDYRKFGDLVLWYQIMDRARDSKKPMLFITKDQKSDWWEKADDKKIIGPRPELVQEMYEDSGMSFHAYQYDQFIKYISSFIQQLNIQESFKRSEKLATFLADRVRIEEMFDKILEDRTRFGDMLYRIAYEEAVKQAKDMNVRLGTLNLLLNDAVFRKDDVSTIWQHINSNEFEEFVVNSLMDSFDTKKAGDLVLDYLKRELQSENFISKFQHAFDNKRLDEQTDQMIEESIRKELGAVVLSQNFRELLSKIVIDCFDHETNASRFGDLFVRLTQKS